RRHGLTLFDRVMFMRSMNAFKGLSGLSLSFIADLAGEVFLDENEMLVLDEKFNNDFYIVYSGEVDYFDRGEMKTTFSSGQFVGEMLSVPGFAKSNVLRSHDRSILLRISKDQFYELLSENVKLADRVLEYV
ncbi:MAG: cyclic nucleotide-binding domain-containing protein, partial [Bacteroidetes bacterium]|nr:cyclic nucleotide-binding domain-containing protein [Bacteroidota bacterium]